MDIKIVGAVTDENALEEIESIAKVFAYEQRMKDYTFPLQQQHLIKKQAVNKAKKMGENNRFITATTPHILVKGLY